MASVQLRVDRVPAASDTDGATAQTVRMMADYIRKCIDDSQVKAAADYAWRRFGLASPDPALKCWGVFWWVKHCVRFRLDEATLFRIGEKNQQDFLTAPDVLLRMKDPAEDCDGFTMLEAAMLGALGVPVVIATVAADYDDRSRWSHVFPCAMLPGGQVMPLDASHGVGPGWMVPPERIFRWQAWNLDGKPVQVEPMRHRGLHGYTKSSRGPIRWRRGMGDVTCPDGGTAATADDCYQGPTPPAGSGSTTLPFPYVVPGAPAAPASGNSSWDSFWQGLTLGGENILARAVAPPAYQQVTRDAYGNLISTTVAAGAAPGTGITAALGSGLSANTIMIGGGLLLTFLVISMMGRRS